MTDEDYCDPCITTSWCRAKGFCLAEQLAPTAPVVLPVVARLRELSAKWRKTADSFGGNPFSDADCLNACAGEVDAVLAACPGDSDLGLSIDMLDVDRLRDWARLILLYGPDISNWGGTAFVASKMQIMATGMEKAIRDIGTLRAALTLSEGTRTNDDVAEVCRNCGCQEIGRGE